MNLDHSAILHDDVVHLADRAVRMIAPLWPLAASVAVNPYLGHSHESLPMTAARLGKAAGIPLTMPRAFYRAKVQAGTILRSDIEAALSSSPEATAKLDLSALMAAIEHEPAPIRALPSVVDVAAAATGIDWPSLIADRIGAWAAGFFDEGQAMWPTARDPGAYASWRRFACHDLTPEIFGLSGFAAHVASAPEQAQVAIRQACRRLGVTPAQAELYFLGRLHALGGWAQIARYRQWQAELGGGNDQTIIDLLAVALTFETGLLASFHDRFGPLWEKARAAFGEAIVPSRDILIDCVLQNAFDLASQREVVAAMRGGFSNGPSPSAQAVFCIDVRSERFRRALETVDPTIETLGFAGFFGLGLAHRRSGSDVEEARLPVLFSPGLRSIACEEIPSKTEERQRIGARARRAWGRFKLAAVSSFAFVEASGPAYLAKLVRDTFPGRRKDAGAEPPPSFTTPLGVVQKIETAAAILGAMSLTKDFAPIVLLVGHGATVVNNAHAGALQCGACGGHAGDVNARLLASLLNDPAVRQGLVARGIAIPETTLFVGALHDTTTDEVKLFDRDHPGSHQEDGLRRLGLDLDRAAALTRAERAELLPGQRTQSAVLARAVDWAQVRPEWGLAGCRAFVAAPRDRTRHLDLAGRAFLHSYDWKRDKNFRTLELIMTAPVVVASWISLQYYGSTVAAGQFGAGNKLIHNVVGGIGVLEGNGGVLRTGLPWQSVHDGENFAHESVRLSVVVEAPREAIEAVLDQHPDVKDLFDNDWLALFAIDEDGLISRRDTGGVWSSLMPKASHEPVTASVICAA